MYRYVGYLPSSDKARFPEICDEVRSHKPHFPEYLGSSRVQSTENIILSKFIGTGSKFGCAWELERRFFSLFTDTKVSGWSHVQGWSHLTNIKIDKSS